MKNIKKTIAFLLSLIMVFSLLPAQAIAGEETGGGSRGTCKLTLYPNYDDMPASSFDYSSGSPTTPTAFKRTDYLQKKWCTMPDENAEGAECYEIGKSITLNGDLTLYAIWTPGYTITFDKNGGTGTTLPLKKEVAYVGEIAEFIAPECSYKKKGYLFVGWSVYKNNKVDYYPGDEYYDVKDNTLYAVWLPESTLINDTVPVKKESRESLYFGDICWTTLGIGGNRALMISSGAVGKKLNWEKANQYCKTISGILSSTEAAAVIPATKDDPDYVEYMSADLKNERFFLLSAPEAEVYFYNEEDREIGSGWWLRSLIKDKSSKAGYVDSSGIIKHNVNFIGLLLRPAFVLDLDRILLKSAANGDKFSAPSDGSSFGAFNDGGDGEKKLTLLDDSRDGFIADIGDSDSAEVHSGGILAVNYGNAKTGENEYISAMLCNESGDVIGYASRKTPSTSGTWDLRLPFLESGIYTLKVFSEQQNNEEGKVHTDYASPMKEMALTVIRLPGELRKPIDKVPPIGDEGYPSSDDNFAPVPVGNKISKMQLDFSKVKESGVDPSGLKMTVIKGSKFTTVSKIAEGSQVQSDGGVKVKVNKKGIATITCKGTGSATLPMEDGVTYTVSFTVDKPKAKKLTIPVGSGRAINTIRELFDTGIDSGTLTATLKKSASKATISADNTLVIDPDGPDTIKVQYQYLNKKYKTSIKVK